MKKKKQINQFIVNIKFAVFRSHFLYRFLNEKIHSYPLTKMTVDCEPVIEDDRPLVEIGIMLPLQLTVMWYV